MILASNFMKSDVQDSNVITKIVIYQSEGRERLMTAPGHVIARGLLPSEVSFPAAAAGTLWCGILDRFSVYPKA